MDELSPRLSRAPADDLRKTLRTHYAERRRLHGVDYPNFYDRDLRRLFAETPSARGGMSAARFLRRIRKEVRRRVAEWTGVYQYTIDQVLQEMIVRCRQLRLRLVSPPEDATLDFAIVLAVHTVNYLHGGRHRVAL